MRNNLIIINSLEKLDKYLNKISKYFPKKEIILKREINKVIRNIYLKIYLLVYNYDKDIGTELISLINYLNFLVDTMYQKKIINNIRYLYIGNLVIDITKLLRGYINEKNKQYI